ncbi:phosphatase [Streptomyces avidinii]
MPELIDHLVRTRIAGQVATPRESDLSHYRKLADGDRRYWLGLEPGRPLDGDRTCSR